MKLSAATFFFLFFNTLLMAQGPISGFMLEAGTHDFAISYAYESFEEYIFGEEKRSQSLETVSYNLFYEHGLSSKSALVLSVPYLEIDETNRGLQDGSLFFKYRHKYQEKDKGDFSLISAWGLTTPLSNYPKDTDTPIGVGAPTLGGRLVAQYNFNSGLFLHAQSGLDFRLLDVPQVSVPILLRAGYGAKHYFVEGWVEWFNTLENGVDQNVTGGSGSDWLRIGGTLYVPVPGIQGLGVVGNFAQIVNGKNIGLSSRYGAGLVYRLKRKRP